MADINIATTYGALLIGALLATGLSGIVMVQSCTYIRQYPTDLRRNKLMVLAVWMLDTGHTGLVWASVWTWLIEGFGDTSMINTIPRTVAMSIILTAILTFIVHCFFAYRIHKLSRSDWRITIPLLFFAFLRLCSATVTTAEMIHTKTFSNFKQHFRWVFTLGLALSFFVDVLITAFLCYSLRGSRKASSNSSINHVINSVILYTFENGSITCTATSVSMICWLTMPNNLIFMALHFAIGKFYANSLLVTLNARKQLERERTKRGLSGELPIAFPGFSKYSNHRHRSGAPTRSEIATKLEINVEKTVQYNVDGLESPLPATATTPSTLNCNSEAA